MMTQQKSANLALGWAVAGVAAITSGMLILVNLLLGPPVQGKTLSVAALAVQPQQSALVNGRSVYAAPIVTGQAAVMVLQGVPANGIAYVVHTFDGRGKLVATANSWFRCADIVSANQYNGGQLEVESWVLLTEQERLEAQAACAL
ncbi:MAG: hypothetical protein KF832_25490 [Caldilineaceae bacterium]|nr:hypothetical protein [Caldilineaceae bacterium]